MLNFYQYSAFGETIISEESIPNRLRYNAQTEDELTGLYYLRARYYAPNIGRFTQEDVIYNDGLNLYAYCDSNPVMYCDPSGFSMDESIPISEMPYADIKKELNSIYLEFVKKKKLNVPSVSNKLLKAELDYGKYGKLPKKKGDNITGQKIQRNI